MNNRKPSLRQRIGAAIAGRKDFIPPLNPFDGMGYLWGNGRTHDYKQKGDQITANIGWSFTANNAIVQPAAAVEFELYQVQKDGEREQIFSHPILDLLDNPNAAHTGEQLRQLHYTYMNFTGESYILMTDAAGMFEPGKGKLPMALQVLESHLVQFKMEPQFSKSVVKIQNVEYPITSIIRDINPNPMSPYNGMSVIEAAARTLDLDRAMTEWNQSLVANGAKPTLVFSSNEPMDEDSYRRWKQQFQDQNTGAANAGKPLLIEGGTATPWMMSPQDLDFLNSRKFSMNEILGIWRVPPAVLGMTTDFNRANMDAATIVHTTMNVVPRVRQFVQQLNQTLIKPYDPTLVLDFKNPVPEDQTLKLQEATQSVNSFRTIDEVRAMYGDKPLPDGVGAQLYMPAPAVSLDSIANPDAEDPDAAEDENEIENDPQAAVKALYGVKKKT